jgi:3,4-dihydroxy 2-butanone 4-phosphate synthase/GTP cyclohydrolase II
VICEVMNDDGTMARLPDLQRFAAEHGLKIGTIADLIQYRSRNETLVTRGPAPCRPPRAPSTATCSATAPAACTWP